MTNTENKRAYDLTVLLEDEEVSFLEELVRNTGAEDLTRDIKKMNFAYEIEEVEQGFMAVFKFWADGESISGLEEALRADQRVLRYLLLRDKLKEKRSQGSESDKKEVSSSPSSKPSKEESSQRLTNEAIEEKIEEMKEE